MSKNLRRETIHTKVWGDHERRLLNAEKRTDGPWIYVGGTTDDSPPFENGWDNVGGTATPARFRWRLDGNLDLELAVGGGDLGTVIFTLPDGWRPDYDARLTAVDDTGTVAIIEVLTDGSVSYATAGIAGPTGATGVGTTGATGVGTQGATGVTGATGAGTTGATGAGTQGATGVTGATGVGTTGATGVGTQGATGVTGATGAGTTGATGAGTQGATGVTGATGVGTTGATGPLTDLISSVHKLTSAATVATSRSAFVSQPFTVVNAYTAAVLANSPRVYFKLNEATGSFQDISGNSQVGTEVGGSAITRGVVGPLADLDTGITVDGTNYVTVPDSVYTDTGDVFSVEFWIKYTFTGVRHDVISKGNNTYDVHVNASNQIEFQKQNVTVLAKSSRTNMNDGQWHHVVCTHAAGAVGKIYIDGANVSQQQTAATCSDTNNLLFIGAFTGGTNTFVGSIDEVAIYNTELTQADVTAHYAARLSALVNITLATDARLVVVP